MIDISVVLPAYNEEENILAAIRAVDSFLKKKFKNYEIVVVNDGSSDKTAEIAQAEQKLNEHIRLVSYEKNKGYGAAVWRGMSEATGELVFMTDADLQFEIRELDEFLANIKDCDVVCGYRRKRSEGWRRALNAWGWRVLCRSLLKVKVRDIDCAFKLFRRAALDKVTITSDGAAFSAELLYKLDRSGAKIIELPVNHYPRTHGRPTGAKFSVIAKAFREIYTIYRLDKKHQ